MMVRRLWQSGSTVFEADFASDDAHSVKPARSFANSKELVSADFFSLQAIRMLK